METIDEEVNAKALDFMDRAKKADKPFFVWWNSTKMHIFTHLKPGVAGKTGLGIYADGMVEHDRQIGELLTKLKELGIENDTIVMYSTDNGAEAFTWPDGGTTMFRGEKNTQWEGGYRVPCAMKWPRKDFIYWTDDGQPAALRYENWKITFLKQNAHGLHLWQTPFEELRAPLITNLRMDPFSINPPRGD